MLTYLKDLLQKSEEPGDPKFESRLRNHRFWKAEDHPPLAREILGSATFIVISVLSMGEHLQAYKQHWQEKHKNHEKLCTNLTILSENSLWVEAPAENAGPVATPCGGSCKDGVQEDDRVKRNERILKEDIAVNVLGKIPHSDLFPVGIEKIEKDAHNVYKSGLPEFMKLFLERMNASAESHRQGNCGELREVYSILPRLISSPARSFFSLAPTTEVVTHRAK